MCGNTIYPKYVDKKIVGKTIREYCVNDVESCITLYFTDGTKVDFCLPSDIVIYLRLYDSNNKKIYPKKMFPSLDDYEEEAK